MNRAVFTAVVGLFVGLVACSSPTTEGEYVIRFPSTASAIATDTIVFNAFLINDLDGPTKCADLIARRAQGGQGQTQLPARTLETSTKTCDYFNNARTFQLDYGTYAFLVVGQRAKVDVLVGCNVQIIGEGNAAVALELFPITKAYTEVPTTCSGLAQFCNGGCP